jgi:hypothetical protein
VTEEKKARSSMTVKEAGHLGGEKGGKKGGERVRELIEEGKLVEGRRGDRQAKKE